MEETILLPRGPEDITIEWLTSVIGNRLDADTEILSVETAPVPVSSFICQVLRVDITYAPSGPPGPASVIAKLPSTNEQAQMLGAAAQLWIREGVFYEKIAPSMSVRLAKCWHVGMHLQSAQAVILLEDLSHLSAGDQLAGADAEISRVATDWIADFHSSWWGDAASLPALPTQAQTDRLVAVQVQTCWAPFLDKFGDAVPAAAVPVVERAVAEFGGGLISEQPLTLIHNDYRLDNFMIDSDGDITVVDWQTMVIGPGVFDLAYFIAGSVPAEARTECERSLLRRYCDRLRSLGVTIDDEQIFTGYRESVLRAAALIALGGGLDTEADPRANQFYRCFSNRLFTAVEDLWR